MELSENEEQLFKQIIDSLCLKYRYVSSFQKSTSIFSVNPYTRTVINENGYTVYLTAKEFDLLYFFYTHKGQVFSKEQLYENVWGYDNISDGSNLTSFIRKLRKK